MKKNSIKNILQAITLAVGLVLMVSGIILDKQGATVIGIIVAGVIGFQWMRQSHK
jgi:hypothetical protein